MKDIQTSITITESRKERVIHAARCLGVPVKIILAALMRKSRLIYDENLAVLWKAVQYQNESSYDKYFIWHVSLDVKCYEYGVSERLFFKVSVSCIYGVLIDLFLDRLVNEGLDTKINDNDISTNYKLANYGVIHKTKQKKEIWTVVWDKRIKEEKIRKKGRGNRAC